MDDRVIVEVRNVEHLARAHPKQLLTYLKLTNRQVGLLINFGAAMLLEGLRRIVNGFPSFRYASVRPLCAPVFQLLRSSAECSERWAIREPLP